MSCRLHSVAISILVISMLSLGMSSNALAQSDKTIKILVGFPPGGALDGVARLLAEKMKDDLKQNVMVENKPGAGGGIAAEALKNAAPDGTTLMVAPIVVTVLAPLVRSKLPYNPAADFAPVGHIGNFSFALTVNANHPAKNVKELLSWMKANPSKATFGSPAAGSFPHFFGLLLGKVVNADMVHVAYQGGAPLKTALLGDQIPIGIDTISEWLPNHQAGKVRILATSGTARSKVVPEVATFREQGYPNIVGGGWLAMYTTAKTPASELDRLNKSLVKALALKEVSDKLLAFGMEVGGGSPTDLTKIEQADTARWAPIIKASGFRAD